VLIRHSAQTFSSKMTRRRANFLFARVGGRGARCADASNARMEVGGFSDRSSSSLLIPAFRGSSRGHSTDHVNGTPACGAPRQGSGFLAAKVAGRVTRRRGRGFSAYALKLAVLWRAVDTGCTGTRPTRTSPSRGCSPVAASATGEFLPPGFHTQVSPMLDGIAIRPAILKDREPAPRISHATRRP